MANTESALAKKLQLPVGQRFRVINGGEGRSEALVGALDNRALVAADGDAAVVFVIVLAEADALAAEGFALGRDALVWLAYPKGGSKVKTDVNRDRLWKALEASGWRPVRQVAIDDTWSALRFRPAELVG